MALLDVDKKLVKELEIGEIHELSKQEKTDFLDAQLEAYKTTLWRLRVEYVTLSDTKPDGEAETEERDTKLRQSKNDIRRITEGVTRLEAIKSEL